MHRHGWTVCVVLLFAFLGATLYVVVASASPDVPVVSYMRTWPIGSDPIDMEAGQRWSADDIEGDLLSTVNIAFGLLDGNRIYIKDLVDQPGEVNPDVTVKAFDNLFDEVARAQAAHPHLKFNLSVGGWGAEGFSDMAMSVVSRYEFIADALDWIVKYNLDGIDVDWEYPVGPPWGGLPIVTRAEDAANLYNHPDDPDAWSTDQAVTAFLNTGVEPGKLLMGVPFYGRGWSGVAPGDSDGLFQPYEHSKYEDGINFMDIQSHILTDADFVRYWDDVAKAAYLYDGDSFITYEDAESLGYKVDYIREKGLAGIMIWEYGHDLNAELLQALNAFINRR